MREPLAQSEPLEWMKWPDLPAGLGDGRRYREMFDALPAAIYTTDAQGQLTYFNPACVEFSGRTPKVGSDCWCVTWKLYHPDGTPMPHDTCPMAIALKEGRMLRGAEAIAERPDGTRMWFIPHPTVLRDADGRIVGGINMLVDITQRKRQEEALRQSEQDIRRNEAWLAAQKESLQAALNGQPLEHSLGALVRSACDRFGPGTRTAFYRASADGTTLHHIVGMAREYAEIIDGFKISLESFSCGLAAHTRQPVLTADVKDEPRWQSWLGVAERFGFRGCWSFPLHAPKGELLGTFAVYWREPHRATEREVAFASALTDTAAIIISHHDQACVRQQATANLARAKEEAEAANIAKDNFLATLSHELRTPLTPVLATLSSWETHRAFPRELAEDLEMVRRNVDLEARLIDDLLDLTRIAKGKIALNFEVLDVQKVLEAVVAMYLSEIRGKRINLSLRLDAGPCYVRGDPGRLQQAFWNVLKNSVKFTPEGGKIEIATRNDQQGHVQIRITDTGIGMTPEMLGRLFQPFEQETAGRYGGLGLGLAITKTLLEAQQGTIGAKSDGPGKGASFIITLPCLDHPPIAAELTSSARSESDGQSSDGGYRLLLVEDHVDTARVLARLLEANGHTVTTAHSIGEALGALRSDDFDVLLSDIGLPDGTGIDLIRAVREELCKTMPAVALTGFGMEEDVTRTLQAGFNDHLTKPVNFARLEQTLRRACNSSTRTFH